MFKNNSLRENHSQVTVENGSEASIRNAQGAKAPEGERL